VTQGRILGGFTLLIVIITVVSLWGRTLIAHREADFINSLSGETRVQGQFLPPKGVTLKNEAWIVSDFSSLASGIAQDLATERTPLIQEIQGRQEHLQRAQAEVASRDERIRLLREEIQASKNSVKLTPESEIADLNKRIEALQKRVDATAAEEVPLKTEVQQAHTDLATAQDADAGLDNKYYRQLYFLPEEALTQRIPLDANGRFIWVDKDVFNEGENEHSYWIFARAVRADGRQYWALHHFVISKNQILEINIGPIGFISTKAILRPDLSPDEQAR
jgi:hypothetical protein